MSESDIDQQALELFLHSLALVHLEKFVGERCCGEEEISYHYNKWKEAISNIYKNRLPLSIQETLSELDRSQPLT